VWKAVAVLIAQKIKARQFTLAGLSFAIGYRYVCDKSAL
jgi:hypothetical protein